MCVVLPVRQKLTRKQCRVCLRLGHRSFQTRDEKVQTHQRLLYWTHYCTRREREGREGEREAEKGRRRTRKGGRDREKVRD